MIWATSHLLDHMEVSHIEHLPDITDHASVKATIDLEMQREGPLNFIKWADTTSLDVKTFTTSFGVTTLPLTWG